MFLRAGETIFEEDPIACAPLFWSTVSVPCSFYFLMYFHHTFSPRRSRCTCATAAAASWRTGEHLHFDFFLSFPPILSFFPATVDSFNSLTPKAKKKSTFFFCTRAS